MIMYYINILLPYLKSVPNNSQRYIKGIKMEEQKIKFFCL